MSPPLLFDLAGSRVAVCGHKGLAGSAIVRRLASEHCEIITAERATVDLTYEEPTAAWLARTKPDALFLAAARVGGIHANSIYPADFIAEWKWDGIRVQAVSEGGAERLYSRTGEDVGGSFPDILDNPNV